MSFGLKHIGHAIAKSVEREMKTTKEQRIRLRDEAYDCFCNTGSWKRGSADTSRFIMDCIDDLSELEAKLDKCREALRFYSSEECISKEYDETTGEQFFCEGLDFNEWGRLAREALGEID